MKEEKRWITSKVLFSEISKQLAENRQAVFTVTGMSMWPFLCHGRDKVIVGSAKKEDLKIGDIVLYRFTEDRYILHRITYLDAVSFQTTGDGNLTRDKRMPYESIVAKVNYVIRKGERINCSNWKWKMVSAVWLCLFPVRKWIFCIGNFYKSKQS